MGLFDYINIPSNLLDDSRLNGPSSPKVWKLQTKDLGCSMSEYLVTKTKRLKEKRKYYKERKETPTKKNKRRPDVFAPIEVEHIEEIPVKRTVTVVAYELIHGEKVTDNDIWFDVELVFVNGILKSNKVLEYTVTSSKERIEALQKWNKEIEQYNTNQYQYELVVLQDNRKIKRCVRETIFRIGEYFVRFGSSLQRIAYKIK